MPARRRKLLHKTCHLNRRTIRCAKRATKLEFAHGKHTVAVVLREATGALRKAAALFAVAEAAQ